VDGLPGNSEGGGDHLPPHAQISSSSHERSFVSVELGAHFADGMKRGERIVIAGLCGERVEGV
jgi:hypothetical protein